MKAPPGSPLGALPNPLWPGGTHLTEARYIPRGLCDAYHLSEGTSTALAEFEQLAGRVPDPVFDVGRTNAVLLRVEWQLTGILDLCDEAVRDQLGVDEAALVSHSALLDAIDATGDPHAESLPQVIGRAAYGRPDMAAIRYPSARRKGGENLVVFRRIDRNSPRNPDRDRPSPRSSTGVTASSPVPHAATAEGAR